MSEQVYAFGFSDEEDLQLVSVLVLVEEVGQSLVDRVLLFEDVHWPVLCKGVVQLLQCLDLCLRGFCEVSELLLGVPELFDELKSNRLGLKDLLLKLDDLLVHLFIVFLDGVLGRSQFLQLLV